MLTTAKTRSLRYLYECTQLALCTHPLCGATFQKALIIISHHTTAKHAGRNAGGANLWILDMLFILCFPLKERERMKLRGRWCEIERQRVREGVRGRERAICFERSFQVAISSVLIDNTP